MIRKTTDFWLSAFRLSLVVWLYRCVYMDMISLICKLSCLLTFMRACAFMLTTLPGSDLFRLSGCLGLLGLTGGKLVWGKFVLCEDFWLLVTRRAIVVA